MIPKCWKTKFDKPVIHNRKLLDALYFGVSGVRPSVVAPSADDSRATGGVSPTLVQGTQ